MTAPRHVDRDRLNRHSLQHQWLIPGLCAACVGAVMSAPVVAWGQTPTITGEFPVQRFDPAPGPRNFFVTRTARSDGKNTWSAGFVFDYSAKPFTVQTCDATTNCTTAHDIHVIESMATGHVLASFTPRPQLQVGLGLPITYTKGEGLTRTTLAGAHGSSHAFVLGDPMLEAKYRFFGKVDSPLAAAVGIFGTLPVAVTMAKYHYIGDRSVTGGLRAIADMHLRAFSIAGNVAGVLAKTAQVGDAKMGSELRGSIAAGYQVSPLFKVVVETFGNSRFDFDKNGTSSLEALLGAQFTPMRMPIAFMGGLGTGIVRGIGAPTVRGFVGVTYVHENHDRDSDGIVDELDQCPTAGEDFDGFQDSDGCPDLDNDGDGIADVNDKCPDAAEDFDGFEDQDGCPEVDNDKDGIPDDADHCPNQPETMNGYKDTDGCPDEADSDGDGVPDARDKCPNEMEDTDGFEDEDGCPDLDNDKDGVPDDSDECLNEPETINGFQDADGCPDEPGDAAKDHKKDKKKEPGKAAPAAGPKALDLD
jgi:OmpA-OmpF porin, OOP family